MASKYSPEMRAHLRRLARDGEAGADAQQARRMLLEDGQNFTIFDHKVGKTPTATKNTRK